MYLTSQLATYICNLVIAQYLLSATNLLHYMIIIHITKLCNKFVRKQLIDITYLGVWFLFNIQSWSLIVLSEIT